MNLKFTNNASAKLAEAISSTSTTLKVESDKGSLFPSITSPEYFYVTLVGDSVMEIVKVTARNSDTFTIVRAQDGTTAQAFSTGDVVELRITAAAFNDISTAIDELDAFPEQTGNSGKYLQTDGTNVKWSTVDTYPSQSGKSGQSLVTDGASTLWHPIAQDILDAAEAASAESDSEISGTTADSIMSSITQLESGKAETDLSNLSSSGRSLAAGLGMPSGRYVDLTLGASGSSFTAPADGFFCLAKTIGTSGAYLSLFNTDAFFGVTAIATSTTNIVRIFIPAKKGQTINVGYNATGATQYFRFIYAEGAE